MKEQKQVLGISTAYCVGCQTSHDSTYEDVDGKVVYTINCPATRPETMVSSDAKLFTTLRARSLTAVDRPNRTARKYHFYVIPITDQCNCECPICYAEGDAGGQRFLPVEELRAAALLVKANGGKRLSLSGGEPTLHPQLPEMVHMVRQEIGLSPVLVTNGLRIAEDDSLLLRLKRAGLRRVQLQFDTFNNDTYRAMRGRTDVREKLRAVDHIVAAGMHLGLVATICSLNLGETGELLQYAQALVPAIRILVFQPTVPAGRFPADLQTVTREDIIRVLTDKVATFSLQPSDFFPFPNPYSGHAAAHPDCSAHALMCSDGKRCRPLNREMERKWPGETNKDDRRKTGLLAAEVLPAQMLRGVRQLRRRKMYPFFVSIISFMRPEARDDERLRRCVVAAIREGSLLPFCSLGCEGATRPFTHGYVSE
jgi:uncharacterized radical SAM superfamily Fe-S cluster-containing enzyme